MERRNYSKAVHLPDEIPGASLSLSIFERVAVSYLHRPQDVLALMKTCRKLNGALANELYNTDVLLEQPLQGIDEPYLVNSDVADVENILEEDDEIDKPVDKGWNYTETTADDDDDSDEGMQD
ncbi:Uu.00g020980.m01.CDS01 [Anthostomella pinea]|uniref:Uu.00g020980.m01.CDS01 n=1 Tax=Anthostomella pinea TaxID=933095 RepID=A0AAI8W079_9PEZI|nr:Uu.00g020980.m01.CDS01 [Anthostomella pinea]